MKKRFFILFIIFSVFFTGCSLLDDKFESNDHYEITLKNYTDMIIMYSFVNGPVVTTNGTEFYNSYNNFVKDYFESAIYKRIICAKGTVKDGLLLDEDYIWLKKGEYDITVFVCKSNNYTTNPPQYIGKGTIHITGDRIITISANGAVY